MNFYTKAQRKFIELYNRNPVLFRSPGRVNLIGEHTDYNMGFVLPAAIDRAIYFAIAPRDDEDCHVFAVDMNESVSFSINNLNKSEKGWPNYLMGVVDQLIKADYKFKGFDCVFGGDIPIGAGLSSSAALEAGLTYALNHIYKLKINKLDLVKFAQKAENEFVGVNCGIMDQYVSVFGKKGNVLRIDCRSLEYEYFPFDYEYISIVLFDTCISHSLASSEYNKRRKECAEGVEIIKKRFQNVESLRDVSADMLNEFRSELEPTVFRRCKYVVTENERLMKACEVLNTHDLKTFGSLMYETHKGLSEDYEVSCKELDFLVNYTMDKDKVYGSRMMGGGFGGCTINLIENSAIDSISKRMKEEYKKEFNIEANVYVTKISSGTNKIEIKEDVTI